MRNETRLAFDRYVETLASLNGVGDATRTFNVAPSVAQTLEDRIAEQADYLRQVNVVPVGDQVGEKLGLGAARPAASRTDTSKAERETRDITDLTGRGYQCAKTNFDTHVTYDKLDAWAKFPDFQVRIRNHVTQQVARDRLMIGFNGTSAAAETDLDANPLLQDVNAGWLEKLRVEAPERVLSGVKIGPGGDYETVDAAVYDAVHSLLDPWHRQNADTRVHLGDEMLTDKYLGLLNAADRPTEQNALSTLLLNQVVAGRTAITPPFFPGRSILVTMPQNLSVYWQEGATRRRVVDNPKRDRIEDYLQMREAYVVEDLGAACLIEGILTPDGQGGWA
ncbi:phage major capsid protein, P2 family [Rhodothalassium salexigens]|uniref:phage major capsid protein, P2 family n=1 Tax=Rhodothalassium salexigens TaxID=1086 RepID=UPI001914CE9A|nr:phage major capsid protein, P2 family [Rhodothalassium salexigens]MBK5910141.1 phage major capsid protein, P2 family [Rhodothalassium salexigens]MBK5920763.1 phage major capsid protein, P2 family [Rhodothalassium salexigens]